MMKKYLSLILLVIIAIVVVIAVFKEKVTVYSLNDNSEKQLDGYDYTETATYDGLILNKKDGRLYDAYSLTPEVLQLKDCPS